VPTTWRDLGKLPTYEAFRVEHPAVSTMLSELRGTRAVLFGAFRVVGGVATRREFYDHLFDQFLGSEAPRVALAELEVPVPVGEGSSLLRLAARVRLCRITNRHAHARRRPCGDAARRRRCFRFPGTPTEAKRIGTALSTRSPASRTTTSRSTAPLRLDALVLGHRAGLHAASPRRPQGGDLPPLPHRHRLS
jgi:hypothetical protein